ncbi:cation:proton antiporter [Patescibacteria group bacterium]|nr:cation:proton antiporter [Patescibacteria group bacterium]MCL5091918.1 cation:proton antiporter [Patescibacteria group bacterium]
MGNIPAGLFLNFFVFLFVPFIVALFLKRYRLSPLIGYIVGGVILSGFIDGMLSRTTINQFAFFGIVLLLFTVGLETRFERMLAIKRFIVIGGLLQVGLSIIALALFSLAFGFSLVQAILVGIALASSSTSLVAKIIQERGEEHSFLGELALGILMFQDLAFVPFMIIFTAMTVHSTPPLEIAKKIAVGIVSSALILSGAYYFGNKILPRVFNLVARRSRELLNLFIILLIFLIAYVSTLLAIPILVSVFVAGIVISQTLEHYHIFSQIRPLRDLLAIIFFIYIGTNVKLDLIVPLLPTIVVFTMAVILIKAVIIFVIFSLFKFQSRLSFYLAFFLFQIDEDAFILMSLGYMNGVFSQPQYLFVITAVLLSLVITPILIGNKERCYAKIKAFLHRRLPLVDAYIHTHLDAQPTPIDALDIKNHIIICGYGRIGSSIGRALTLANLPFLAIDYNFHTVERAKKNGVNIIYGDPTDSNILDYAEVETATALVLALPDRFSQEAIVLNARSCNPNIVIISRVHRRPDQQRMRDLGVSVIVQPEFEAALSIIKKLLYLHRVPREDIIKQIQYIKRAEEGI